MAAVAEEVHAMNLTLGLYTNMGSFMGVSPAPTTPNHPMHPAHLTHAQLRGTRNLTPRGAQAHNGPGLNCSRVAYEADGCAQARRDIDTMTSWGIDFLKIG